MALFRGFIFLALGAVFSACTLPSREQVANATPASTPAPAATAVAASTPEPTPESAAGRSATLACQSVDTGKFEIYTKQTFPIDFEPFRNSCFVTSYNPQYKDPPMESKFAIYKNGRQVFDFPSQFNNVNFGCWIDAVSFQDLNDDKKTDVVVISKCQAKMGDYNENTIYVNDGKGFSTRDDANTQLGEFKTIKQVADFVHENRSMFF